MSWKSLLFDLPLSLSQHSSSAQQQHGRPRTPGQQGPTGQQSICAPPEPQAEQPPGPQDSGCVSVCRGARPDRCKWVLWLLQHLYARVPFGQWELSLRFSLLQNSIASKGRGILAMDESNATCGKRLESINVDNTEENRRAYRELLVTTPGLGEYISGAIMFEETLYQSTRDGKKFTDVLNSQNIMPGIKVDKGLVPLPNSNNESWCQGLDGLAQRCAEYYKQGARFAKWRSVISIPSGELGVGCMRIWLIWACTASSLPCGGRGTRRRMHACIILVRHWGFQHCLLCSAAAACLALALEAALTLQAPAG